MRRVLCLLAMVATHSAPAFESYPDYRWITPETWQSFPDPNLASSEYSSDFLTYSLPVAWEFAAQRSSKWFSLGLGSVSSKEFHTDQRLHLYHDLLPEKVEARIHWFSQKTLEDERGQMSAELIAWLSSDWGISGLGTADLNKANNDVGVAVYRRLNDQRDELKVYSVWPDFQRNKRNRDTDRWLASPWVVGVRLDRRDELQFSWRHEQQTILHLPDEDRDFIYSRDTLQALGQSAISGPRREWRLLLDDLYEANRPDDASSAVSESIHRTKRWLWTAEDIRFVGPHEVRLGLSFFYREFGVNGERVIARDILPALWWSTPERGREGFSTKWQVGYDATYHRIHDPGSLLATRPDAEDWEHRLNVVYNFNFSTQAQLRLFFTFDIDRFGSGETWEGGCGQLQMVF